MTATLRQPLSNLQLELLDLFSRNIPAEELLVIKKLLSDYFAKKAIEEADRLWDERGYTQETMKNWLATHLRTPYQR